MAEWIKSGVLDSVDQIGMEMHTGRVHVKPESHVRVIRDLVGYFQGRPGRGNFTYFYGTNLVVSFKTVLQIKYL